MPVSICHCFSSSQSAFYFLNGQVQFLQQHNYKISFAVPDDGFVNDLTVMFPGVDIYIIPIVRNISPFKDLKALIKFVTLFRKERFDIIHLHTPKAGLLGSIAARLIKHPHIVFHLHGLVSLKWNKLKRGITLFMEKVPLILAHSVISVSASLEQLCIAKNLVSPTKITTLKYGSINGISYLKKFNPKKIDRALHKLTSELQTKNKFVVGFLGRMNSDKGLADIITVANDLNKDIPNLLLVFVGPNEMDIDVNNYLNEHLTMPFKYYPRTKQPELYISLFDVMLFPSYREGFGLVAAEANALEVPVVAYNIVGVQDAISDKETGLLVKPGDLNALANAVKFYSSHPEVRRQHGINGRKRVIKYFTPEEVWQAQLDFYEVLLNG